MRVNEEDKERLFRALCARALQRHGEGFPSTDEEIAEFESFYQATEEERERMAGRLQRVIARVREEGARAGRAGGPREGRTLRDLFESSGEKRVAAAARGAQIEGLSPDLAKKLERIIREDEEPPQEQDADGQTGEQDDTEDQ